MADIVMIAKDFELEVKGDGEDFLKVPQLTSLTYTQGANEVDLSNFDDDGFKSSMVVSRTRTLTFECNYLVDEDTKELNPALKLISDLNNKVGYEAIGTFRLTFPNGDKIEFRGTVSLNDMGGGVDDKLTFGGTITVNGKPVEVTE